MTKPFDSDHPLDPQRGHAFLPTDIRDTIPALGTNTANGLDEIIVHVHYTIGNCHWFIAEIDTDTGEAFGWAELLAGCGEWGYVDLPELADLEVGTVPVSRDLDFVPTRARDALAPFRREGHGG